MPKSLNRALTSRTGRVSKLVQTRLTSIRDRLDHISAGDPPFGGKIITQRAFRDGLLDTSIQNEIAAKLPYAQEREIKRLQKDVRAAMNEADDDPLQ